MRIEVEPIIGEAPLHNLLASSMRLDPDVSGRWENGITWEQEGCNGALSFQQLCDMEPAITGTGTQGGPGESDAVTYYLAYECPATGRGNETKQDAVTRQLDVAAIKALEADFWQYLQNNTPNVSGSGGDATGGVLNVNATSAPVAVTPEVALLQLSQALANCGGAARGMIHAPVYLVESWAQKNYIEDNGDGYLRTRGRGDIVVAGSGYTGVGPIDNPSSTPPDGTAWAYATRIVGVWEGATRHVPLNIDEALNRANNIVRWTAEKSMLTQVDACCMFATLVDTP